MSHTYASRDIFQQVRQIISCAEAPAPHDAGDGAATCNASTCIEALIRRHKHQICPTKKYRQSFLAPVILSSPPQHWPAFIHYGTYGGAHIHDTIAWDMV